MAENDDKRAAIAFSVTLSGQLVTAGLAMMAVEGAFVSYALGSRIIGTSFVVAAAIAALMFISSIFMAGKGITAARNAGFQGNWDLAAGKTRFNLQATFLLLGLTSLVVMFLASGPSKQSEIESRVTKLEIDMKTLRQTVATSNQLSNIQREVHNLQAEISPLLRPVPPPSSTSPAKRRSRKAG
jgi:hypothetical protein